jgi:nucleotide-binding universal stress UspA family protein
MAGKAIKPDWVRPGTILFASESPVNETVFEFALSQAREFHARLIVFHAYDTLMVTTSETSGICYYDFGGAERQEKKGLEPLADRARQAGIECEVVVRSGLPVERILSFMHEREIDRIVMGTHSPGPVGKLLVGSVAEDVLRHAVAPVYIVGPHAAAPGTGDFVTRTVLCAVSLHESSAVVVRFAAELAAQHEARLVLEHVIRPQEQTVVQVGRSLDKLETELLELVPAELREWVEVQTIVVSGDPTEELLYQSRAQKADLIVLGARGASAFAAITRYGIVYKILARAPCPVITLSPVVLAECGAAEVKEPVEAYMGGVF